MLLDFKTKVNSNGNGNYITIDTETQEYNREFSFSGDYITITKTDYKNLLETLERNGYTETVHVF